MTDDAAPRDGDDDLRIDAPLTDRDTDGVAALHDIEAEAGEESELDDMFDLDRREAHELDADLDRVPEEPTLD